MFSMSAEFSPADVIGLAGLLVLIGTHGAAALQLARHNATRHFAFNGIGAACLLYAMADGVHLALAALPAAWLGLSLLGIALRRPGAAQRRNSDSVARTSA